MEFIKGHPAMMIGGDLIVADLHVGIERDKRRYRGAFISAEEKPHLKMADLINTIAEGKRAKRVIILGDLNHGIDGEPELGDENYTPAVARLKDEQLRRLQEFVDRVKRPILLVEGNHEVYDLSSLSRLVRHSSPDLMLHENGVNYLLFHGDQQPSVQNLKHADVLVMGHHHPVIESRGSVGSKKEKVWVHGKLESGKDFVIMPAFSHLIGGTPVSEVRFHSSGMADFSPIFYTHGVMPNSLETHPLSEVNLSVKSSEGVLRRLARSLGFFS